MVKALFSENNIHIFPQQIQKFEDFLEMFVEKNAHINLSAIREPEQIVLKHFVDSCMLSKFLPEVVNLESWILNFLDLGTGWGFPGIPLAILYPKHHFTLLDTRKKKCLCVAEFAKKLNLTNVSVVWWRAEQPNEWELISYEWQVTSEQSKNSKLITRNFWGNWKFDIIVSRAAAHLSKLQEWSYPLLEKDSSLIAYKTPSKEELQESKTPTKTWSYKLDDQERFLLVCKK